VVKIADLNFNLKQGDTHKDLTVALKHQSSGTSSAVDLDGVKSVKLYMKKRNSLEKKIDGETMTVTDATNGYVGYSFSASDVDTPGIYDAEVEVVFSDDSIETFPETLDRIVINIYEEL